MGICPRQNEQLVKPGATRHGGTEKDSARMIYPVCVEQCPLRVSKNYERPPLTTGGRLILRHLVFSPPSDT
jgi:hypothetical protein